MWKRVFCLSLAAVALGWAQIPTPAEHFGSPPGEDYKLADYDQIRTYFEKLDAASDRLTLVEFGTSSEGRPMLVAFLSDPENLEALDSYQEINRRMALGEATEEEAARLAREGKAVVWIDSGLHASEVAPAQHSPELAYQIVTGETDEIRRIRRNVILMQVPVINPDGLEMVADWYRGNVGTEYELAPLPGLYQKYAGHDNNRDAFMMNLAETRAVSRLLYREWFPHIVYNQHQQPPSPARIFIPPYGDPMNPLIPAQLMEGTNLIGAAIKERLARENKPGALSYMGFDAWWNGGVRTAPLFHNMHGILTETAAGVFGTPVVDEPGSLPPRFRNGLPTTEPSIFYQLPWLGGRWGVREAIDYMLTVDMAILSLAASQPESYLEKAYRLARLSIDQGTQGKPFAYILPADQWDPFSARQMLERLLWAGVEVRRARAEFRVGDKTYAAGSYVLLAAQPFRPYLLDLMEPQRYPELRDGSNGAERTPYDVAGWTLRMSMGVDVDPVDKPFEADLEPVREIEGDASSRNRRDNASFLEIARLLGQNERVRWGPDGEILVGSEAGRTDFDATRWQLRRPRVALYEPWQANSDTGWTRWVLDQFKVPYELVHNDAFRTGRLSDYDTIILASQAPMSILHGYRPGEPTANRKPELDVKALQRPEYAGGIGLAGLHHLDEFVLSGGTLIALDEATRLPVEYFPLPVRDVSGGFQCPGSLLHIDVDTDHPLAFGMRQAAIAFSTGGKAFEITLPGEQREVVSVARYATSDLLASGWTSGESAVAGKHILVEAVHGKGKVILFGFRPQFRGQTFGTFKLLLNAIYLASAREL